MPTPDQIKLIHVAAKQVGLNDAQYRTLLSNAAGVESSKLLRQDQFEDVMAVLEDMGFSRERQYAIERSSFSGGGGGSAGRATSTYWRDKVAVRGRNANARMVWKIRELSKDVPRFELRALCLRFSGRRTDELEQLAPREAWQLIEMLKDVAGRESHPPPARPIKEDRHAPATLFG